MNRFRKVMTAAAFGQSLAAGLAAGGLMLAVLPAAAQAAPGKPALPKPFVSRSLDATLMPITPAVRSAFRLAPKDSGVLVVSTDPKGVAAKSGVRPGDVIGRVRGKAIRSPQELDATVLYWLKQGTHDFRFDGARAGKPYSATADITLSLFEAVVDLATIGAWLAVPDTVYFDYGGYYDTYYTEIVSDYDVYVEQVDELAVSDSFESEVVESYEEYSEVTETTEEYSEESSEYSEESTEEYSEESTEVDDESYDDADDGDEADEGDDEGAYDDADDSDEADEGDDGDYDDADEGDDGGDEGDYDDGGDDGGDDYDDGGDE